MISYILMHLPILQLLVPFLGSIAIVLCFDLRAARLLFKVCAAFGMLLSGIGLHQIDGGISYALGGWRAPFGIVFYLDIYNQILIFYSYFILFFVAFAAEQLFKQKLEHQLDTKYQHLLYSFILLFHFASIGVCSTDDLFNLYVFIEISSLAAYSLFSIGTRGASVTALEYLIIGTIAATFLLVGVGVIFSQTGHLNMELNREWLMQMSSPSHYMSLIFIILAVIIKLGLFPFHYWLTRCYSCVSMPLLTYLPSISGAANSYIIAKLLFYLLGKDLYMEQAILADALTIIGVVTVIYMSLMAAFAGNIRTILSYSAIGQIGYIFVILGALGDLRLIIAVLVADGIIKSLLFYVMSLLEVTDPHLSFQHVRSVSRKLLYAVCGALFLSSSLPFSGGFIMKFTILSELLSLGQSRVFLAMLAAAIIGLWYHYRILSTICFRELGEEFERDRDSAHGQYGIVELRGELQWLLLPVIVSFGTIMILWV